MLPLEPRTRASSTVTTIADALDRREAVKNRHRRLTPAATDGLISDPPGLRRVTTPSVKYNNVRGKNITFKKATYSNGYSPLIDP